MIAYGKSDDMWWDGSFMECRFRVYLDDRNSILCRISREAISDHFGNPETEQACFDVAKENFDEITDKVGEMLALERFESDGSILLRTSDF